MCIVRSLPNEFGYTCTFFVVTISDDNWTHCHLPQARSQFKSRSTANNVSILVPVPSDADSPKFKATSGSTKWVPEKNVVQWNIKSFPVSFNKICPKFRSLYYAYVLVIAMARCIMFLGFLFVCSSLSCERDVSQAPLLELFERL